MAASHLNPPQELRINGHSVRFVEKFRYLGAVITNTGSCEEDVKSRIAISQTKMASLTMPLWNRTDIRRAAKMAMYRALITSSLLYGSETWALTRGQEQMLDVFDGKCLRKIEKIRWFHHVSDVNLRRRTKQPYASQIARLNRLRWYGHVTRMEPDALPKRILQFNPKHHRWKRPTGRPRTRWKNLTEEDSGRIRADPADRLKWRHALRRAEFLYATPRWKEP